MWVLWIVYAAAAAAAAVVAAAVVGLKILHQLFECHAYGQWFFVVQAVNDFVPGIGTVQLLVVDVVQMTNEGGGGSMVFQSWMWLCGNGNVVGGGRGSGGRGGGCGGRSGSRLFFSFHTWQRCQRHFWSRLILWDSRLKQFARRALNEKLLFMRIFYRSFDFRSYCP